VPRKKIQNERSLRKTTETTPRSPWDSRKKKSKSAKERKHRRNRERRGVRLQWSGGIKCTANSEISRDTNAQKNSNQKNKAITKKTGAKLKRKLKALSETDRKKKGNRAVLCTHRLEAKNGVHPKR